MYLLWRSICTTSHFIDLILITDRLFRKGYLKKQFSTLSDIAKFYVENRHKLSMPRLGFELNKKELHILSYKIHSILSKLV